MTVGAVHGPQVAAPRWALGPGRAWGANNEAAHIRTCQVADQFTPEAVTVLSCIG